MWLLLGALTGAVVAWVGKGMLYDIAPPMGWVEKVRAQVDASLPFLSPNARALVVAHAAMESGYGRATASGVFNLFNLTRGANDPRPSFVEQNADWEYLQLSGAPPPSVDGSPWQQAPGGGWRRRIPQRWRAYSSIDEGLRDYWEFLGGARYRPARDALSRADLGAFVALLASAGYYTLPETEYLARMEKVSTATSAGTGVA